VCDKKLVIEKHYKFGP